MTCPDAETLAQFAEGSLPEFAREGLLEHLASCDACREAALVLVPEKRATERRIPMRRKGFAWGPWVAAAVALVALGIVWKKLPRPEAPRPAPETAKAPIPETPKPEPPRPADPEKPRPPIDENPKPLPEDPKPPASPEDPAPKPPPPEPPAKENETPAEPPAPTKALAAIRVLDIRGTLLSDGKPVAEGALVSAKLEAADGAGFRVDGNVLAIPKNASLVLGRDGETLTIDVTGGDVFVDPAGTCPVRVVTAEAPLAALSVVNGGKSRVQSVRGLPESRRKEWEALRPKSRTLVFMDFADEKDAVLRAAAQGGPIVGARVQVPAGATWSKKLSVRVRYRTAAKTVQVGLVFKDPSKPWAAMPSAKAGGWQELTAKASDFSAGPTGGASPADGDAVTFVTFAINTEEPGSAGASLELDDLALILEE